MINRLRFKNWRSLRDVEIDDLQPINVFIGANSSGKTNILDGLKFLRQVVRADTPLSTFINENRRPIQTIGAKIHEPIQIEISIKLTEETIHNYQLDISNTNAKIHFHEVISDTSNKWFISGQDGKPDERSDIRLHRTDVEQSLLLPSLAKASVFVDFVPDTKLRDIYNFVAGRWQILDENFDPPMSLSSQETGDVYLLNGDARNLLLIMDFMQQSRPDLYEQLQDDFRWLLAHVEKVTAERTSQETKLSLRENEHRDVEAPTISTGTGRLLAMLTAYYALDMRYPELPGLVVIEEPDTALNPGVLRNFVEQLRYYAHEENPDEYPRRQFILTTHNPAFLDYFEPKEVRVVTRDEQGYTQVNRIPDSVKQIWLDDEEHTLGEVWLTNSFGGLVE